MNTATVVKPAAAAKPAKVKQTKKRKTRRRNVTVRDVNQHRFVVAFAAFLKKSGKLKIPDWVDCVKTGIHKELAPFDPDWFYIRTAGIARRLYHRSPVGVGKLTVVYGGRKRFGVQPAHFNRGSGSVARKALQALEALKILEKDSNNGRRLTVHGRRDMDRIAAQVKRKFSRSSRLKIKLKVKINKGKGKGKAKPKGKPKAAKPTAAKTKPAPKPAQPKVAAP